MHGTHTLRPLRLCVVVRASAERAMNIANPLAHGVLGASALGLLGTPSGQRTRTESPRARRRALKRFDTRGERPTRGGRLVERVLTAPNASPRCAAPHRLSGARTPRAVVSNTGTAAAYGRTAPCEIGAHPRTAAPVQRRRRGQRHTHPNRRRPLERIAEGAADTARPPPGAFPRPAQGREVRHASLVADRGALPGSGGYRSAPPMTRSAPLK